VDTEALMRMILSDGKTLLMPYGENPEAPEKKLGMAGGRDLDGATAEGALGILEPKSEFRVREDSDPDLHLTPGASVDLSGRRLGKGLGSYDRYLAGRGALKAGLAFDVQVTQKNLTLEAHDQLMDAVVSQKRLLVFSAPRMDAGVAQP